MPKRKNRDPYSQLGLAGAAFACVLVGASISRPSVEIQKAMSWLAVGIPLSVASAYGMYLKNRLDLEVPRRALFLVSALTAGIGNIACFGGIYWIFRSISATAANTFLTLSIGVYVIAAGIELALDAFETNNTRVRREAIHAPDVPDSEPIKTFAAPE